MQQDEDDDEIVLQKDVGKYLYLDSSDIIADRDRQDQEARRRATMQQEIEKEKQIQKEREAKQLQKLKDEAKWDSDEEDLPPPKKTIQPPGYTR